MWLHVYYYDYINIKYTTILGKNKLKAISCTFWNSIRSVYQSVLWKSETLKCFNGLHFVSLPFSNTIYSSKSICYFNIIVYWTWSFCVRSYKSYHLKCIELFWKLIRKQTAHTYSSILAFVGDDNKIPELICVLAFNYFLLLSTKSNRINNTCERS